VTTVGIQIAKIPISILEKHTYCRKSAILSLRAQGKESKDTRKQLIGKILHDVFKTFHVEWTSAMYDQEKRKIGLSKLKNALDIAETEASLAAEQNPRYLEVKKEVLEGKERMMEGKMGFKNQILKAARECFRNNDEVFIGIDIVHHYFKGEPQFEREDDSDDYTGRIDVYVEKTDNELEFDIWEFKTGFVPDKPFENHIIEAAGYGVLEEAKTSKKCMNLAILYLGEKKFDIQFTDFHRSKVEAIRKDLVALTEQNTMPRVPMDERCKECEYNDKCRNDESVFGLTGLTPSELDGTQPERIILPAKKPVTASQVPIASSGSKDKPIPASAPPVTPMPGAKPKPLATSQPTANASSPSSSPPITRPDEAITATDEQEVADSEAGSEADMSDEEVPPGEEVDKASGTPHVPTPTSQPEAGEISTPEDVIGIVLQSEDMPLKLSLEDDSELDGAIKQKFQNEIYPGTVLLTSVKEEEDMPSAIVEVKDITSFPKCISAPFHAIQTFNIFIKTAPFMYYEKATYTKVLHPANFNSRYFRSPSRDELMKIMNLYSEGITLGLVTYENIDKELPKMILPYKLPISYKQTGYKGIFIVGSPGKGKTNFIKILISQLSNYAGTENGLPPAIIVLDNTGQFAELEKETQISTSFDDKMWRLLGIDLVHNVKLFKIIYNHGAGAHTLSLSAIDPDLIHLMFRELPSASAQNFARLVRKVFLNYPGISYPEFTKKIKIYMEQESDALNSAVQKTINNAVINGPSEYFDQGGIPLTINDLLVPGQVSVLQVDHIINQVPVLLYVLMMINKRKIFDNDLTPCMIFVDEAHRLFPKIVEPSEQDYLRRVTANMINIARMGRKKHLGIVFASQQPHDIVPEIIGVFQTKIILGLESSSANWIKETLGREYIETIYRLNQGYARVYNAELHRGTLVPLFIPRARNKHEEE